MAPADKLPVDPPNSIAVNRQPSSSGGRTYQETRQEVDPRTHVH